MKIRLSIRFLIIALAIVGVLFTFINGYSATYRAQKAMLVEMALDSNRVYAEKLASTTEAFLSHARSQLALGAELVAPMMEEGADYQKVQLELDRIQALSEGFNSVSVVNPAGMFVSISPQVLGLRGMFVPDSLKSVLKANKPQVIGPMIGPAGKYLVSLTHPIQNLAGEHMGDVVGTIYLHNNNFLDGLLSHHGYDDDSYIYVVSSSKALIYHADKTRIGEIVNGNRVIDRVTQGYSGAQEVVNSRGIAMVSGYAYVEDTGWGIVTQRPLTSVLNELDQQMWLVLLEALPAQAVILLVIGFLAFLVARPLRQLAESTISLDLDRLSRINAWYYEAYQLKGAINHEVDLLHEKISRFDNDRKKDPLTGLLNRRGMEEMVQASVVKNTNFALIVFDIDYFKKVNDQFGHEVGDQVLQFLAQSLGRYIGQKGTLIRTGGEEFVVFLPGLSLELAGQYAEEIRAYTEQEPIEAIHRPVTISLGVSYWQANEEVKEAFRRADMAMYESKGAGRNRVTVLGIND
ncbi:diguanylate cyclase [Maribrevibacterium harenarium]|uniref:diguanylate cyclase n=1 Tax=Maribrevibacterium harenarium TaxID=2589817 RepID=A0A501WRJ8_9GAMM|nr:sensor domain-containing diguanylate cyclase [Maribrevibacterium harenarium]TPE52383.1 diguanylate cyclase [Maribrevibacterium harenarium]